MRRALPRCATPELLAYGVTENLQEPPGEEATPEDREKTSPVTTDPDNSASSSWDAAQRNAFRVAMGDGSLEESLGVLAQAVVAQSGNGTRCAFHVAGEGRDGPAQVIG